MSKIETSNAVSEKVVVPDFDRMAPVPFMPDGPQGGHVILGISNKDQLVQLKEEIELQGKGTSIKTIWAAALKLKIPIVDF